jgi:hypothetical protein
MIKHKVAKVADADFAGSAVPDELRETLGDCLAFLSADLVVCSVCGEKIRSRCLAKHVEDLHYEPDSPRTRRRIARL